MTLKIKGHLWILVLVEQWFLLWSFSFCKKKNLKEKNKATKKTFKKIYWKFLWVSKTRSLVPKRINFGYVSVENNNCPLWIPSDASLSCILEFCLGWVDQQINKNACSWAVIWVLYLFSQNTESSKMNDPLLTGTEHVGSTESLMEFMWYISCQCGCLLLSTFCLSVYNKITGSL